MPPTKQAQANEQLNAQGDRVGATFLLDGMSLAFRAYFALPATLSTTSGIVTNAVHGFVSMVQFIIREHQPGSLAVAFDLPGETFRDEMIADYKAGRAETPNDLPPQFEMIREVMHALAIPVVEAPGFEADDVLATLATEARDRGCDVVVVTGDRDSFQLIEDPHIRVLYNRRGVSDYSLYDEAGIVERCGVPPSKYVMLAAFRGDPSDNLPGIPGVGEKTAAKLLNTYGDLDGIFAHLSEQTPKLRENLTNNEALARSNATVIPLIRDVPLSVHVDQLQLGGWDLKTAEAAFAKYELKTHWQRVEELLAAGALGEAAEGSAAPSGSGTVLTKDAKASLATLRRGTSGEPGEPGEVRAELVDFGEVRVPTMEDAATKDLAALAGGTRSLVARWMGAAGRSPLKAVALVATEGGGDVGAVMVPADLLTSKGVAETLTEAMTGPVVGHQVKEVMRSLLPLGIDCTGLTMDTGVAAYLLDASTGEYELSDLRGDDGQLQLSMGDPDPELLNEAETMVAEGRDVADLAGGFRQQIDALDMARLHDGIETPLVRVLAKMEVAGIGIDRAELTKKEGKRLARELSGNHYLDGVADNLLTAWAGSSRPDGCRPCRAPTVRTDVPQPIFVLGFPRSGTTLMEQTLSAHPRIVAGDELPLINDLTNLMPRMLNSPLGYPEALAELWMGDQREGLDNLRDYYLQKVGADGHPDAGCRPGSPTRCR